MLGRRVCRSNETSKEPPTCNRVVTYDRSTMLTWTLDAGAKTHGDSPTSSSGQATPSNPQSSSSSSGSKEGETPSSSDTTGRTQSKNSASPKFNTVPENQDTEDVKKHNEDVDRRRESSNAGEKDQEVKKGTYSGESICLMLKS